MRRLVLAAALAALLAAGSAAAAVAPGQPPRGKVLLGAVTPDIDGFDRRTGHRHALRLFFGDFRRDVPELLARQHAAGRIPILTLSSGHSPAAIARGAEDARLLGIARAANAASGPVWIRPLAEMNGHWNPWSAFDRSGRPRGATHSTREFVRAFRRIAIISRGGPIEARLRAAGLPPLRADGADVPAGGNVAIVWNPQGEGSPNVRGNAPRDYWPGPGYVDYVANDLYEIRGRAHWVAMDRLYREFPGKPFLIAEWAPWGYDAPAFVRRMFEWVARNPRTVGLVYFDRGWSGGVGTFELARKPQSLAAYRAAATHARHAR